MTHGKKRFKLLRKKRAPRRRPANSTTQNEELPTAKQEAEFEPELVTETGDLSTKLEPPFSTNMPRDVLSFDETTDWPVIRTSTPGTTSSEDTSAQTRQLASPEFGDCIPPPLKTTSIDAAHISEVQYLDADRGVWCSSPAAPAEMPDTKAGEATQATLEGINNLAAPGPSGSDLPMEWKFIVIKVQRLEIQIIRLVNLYHQARSENQALRFKLSYLLGGGSRAAYDELFQDLPGQMKDAIEICQMPEALMKEVDEIMKKCVDPNCEEDRGVLLVRLGNAIEREKAFMSMLRMQAEAIMAGREGRPMDVEKLMRMNGVPMDLDQAPEAKGKGVGEDVVDDRKEGGESGE